MRRGLFAIRFLFTGKSTAHRLLAAAGIGTGDAYLLGIAFTVIVVNTFAGFAVYMDILTSASTAAGSSHAVSFSLLKAATAGLVRFAGAVAGYLDIPTGTQFLLIENTGCC